MADEERGDDGLTVRERRAQHARAQARKDAPARMAKKAIVPAIIVLVLAGIVTGFVLTAKAQDDCPGHWHATFSVYIPDEQGNFTLADFASPQAAGGAYYDFRPNQGWTAPGFSLALHMHQSGGERGPATSAAHQLHYEGGKCVGLADALEAVDTHPTGTSLRLSGDGHEQVPGQADTWRNEGDSKVRYFIEYRTNSTFEKINGVKTLTSADWEWREKTWSQIDGYQLKDGEKLLIAYGDYSDAEIAQMQAAVPEPVSRMGIA